MLELVLLGRGGQGVVIAEEILAKAFFYQGFSVKGFPQFGPDRRGAPVKAFLRISKEPIRESFQIYHPDYFIVFDQSQLKEVPQPSQGIVNCSERKERKGLYCLSAGKIALRHGLGSETNPIINTAMVGAVAGFFPELDFKNVEKGICESLAPSLWEKNIRSAGEAFESIQTIQNKETWSLSCV